MINGTNLGLRSVEISDLSLLKSWRNNDDFRRNFREHKELSDFNQNLWYEKIITSPTDYIFVIEILETREPIGVCGLLYINWITRSADFSFYIGKNNLYPKNFINYYFG
jgi:RimJ/RimL family protein N-acetyltransferase